MRLIFVVCLALIATSAFAGKKPQVCRQFLDLQDLPSAANILKRYLPEFIRTGSENIAKKLVPVQKYVENLFRKSIVDLVSPDLACLAGKLALDGFITKRRNGAAAEELKESIINVCVTLSIESEEICRGAINLNLDIIVYVIDNTPNLDGTYATAIVLQSFGCTSNLLKDWNVDLKPKRENVAKKEYSKEKPSRIAQITDIHYDPLYLEGAASDCRDPLCCQKDKGVTMDASVAAGHWGAYKLCDPPIWVVTDTFEQINKRHTDIDYIYFTGDIISHRVWATNIEDNTKSIKEILALFQQKFKVPIYPIFGNHEPHPLNVFIPNNVSANFASTEWIMKLVAEEWSRWLPEETKRTILNGGYYTVSPKPGFRIIAINSNVCYTFNWWLLHENVDPYGQLQWMANTLAEAEKDEEAVHILSHVPSGDDTCLKTWSASFNKIIKRFSKTITAIFNGHTHNDQFMIYFDDENDWESVAVAYNGGSLTTYSDLNPNYRIYDVDTANFEVLDYEQWIYNLTDANLNPDKSPYWYKQYSFKDAYRMTSLNPSRFSDLLKRMAQSRELMEQYYRFFVKEADTAMEIGCNDNCHKNNLCSIALTQYGDNKKCEEYQALWDISQE